MSYNSSAFLLGFVLGALLTAAFVTGVVLFKEHNRQELQRNRDRINL